MKLELSQVQSNGNWTDVTEEGTLLENLEKGDKIGFSDKNLLSDKRVVLFIHEVGGESPKMLSLSDGLSTIVRKALKEKTKKQVLKALLSLRVITNDKGTFIIPDAGVQELFSVEEVKKEKPVTYQELARAF